MKQRRSRQSQSRSRNRTPSVICLPPPLPPITAKRAAAGTGPALSLPPTEEPLAFESRQVRRQKRRTQAKPVAARTTTPADQVLSMGKAMEIAPLPRNRALAAPRNRRIAAIVAWLRKPLFPRKHRDTNVVGQLQALRDEVVALQAALDRTLARITV